MKRALPILVLTPLLFISSCSKEGNPAGPGQTTPPKIETGIEVTVATQAISTGGGRISVTSSDTLINGLELMVPQNSYRDARTFTISYAPIMSHQFDEFVRPISPLITVSNGGGYADSIMVMRVPIALPDGAYPVAFLYDDKAQTLEPAPMLTFDKHSVTIMSKHFDVGGISSGLAKYSSEFSGGGVGQYAQYLITMVTKKMVDAIAISEPVISTGYLPGVDDWEFVNYGSYLAQGGHCAGQNASSLWYFYEKKKRLRQAPLYHRYDSVNVSPNKIWQDNPLGYRMASAVQKSEDWDAIMLKIYEKYVGMQDDWTWFALVLSMHEFHEPYDIGLYGFDSKGETSGHDVTAYEVNVINGSIAIADPNYPGDRTRRVTYNGATFDIYNSGPNAAAPGVAYRTIKFCSKTATINWSTIGDIWNSVVAQKQNPGFPAYRLRVENGGYDLTDNIATNKDTLDVSVSWAEPNTACYQVFDRTGTIVTPVGRPYAYTTRDPVVLKPGENILGFAIYGGIAPNPPKTTTWSFHWVDFRWIHITYTMPPPVISSIVQSAAMVGDTVKVKGRYFGVDKTKGTVKFNSGIVATEVISWVDTMIAVKVPQGAQTGSVTVTVSALTSNAFAFTVTTALVPLITSLTPNTARVADTISIDGNNFGTDKTKGTVVFTGSLVAGTGTASWTNTRIRVVVPVTAATGPLAVSLNAITSNQVLFTLVGPPSITSVSPTQVSYAMPVRISGKNFGAAQGTSSIRFGTHIPKSVVSWRDNEIVATVPEQFTGGVVTLIISGVTCVSGSLGATLQIVSVTPDSAFANEVVTIHGKQFGYEQGRSRVVVSFVDTATVVSWSDTSIAVIVPDPSNHYYGTKPIKIILGNGIDRTFANFFIIEDVLETLHRTRALSQIGFRAMMTLYWSPVGDKLMDYYFQFGTNYSIAPLTWSGTTFHSAYNNTTPTDTVTITFDGEVSDDGKTLLTITGKHYYSSSYDWSVGYAHTDITELTFKDVPLEVSTPYQNSLMFRVIGAAVRDNVVSVRFESWRQGIIIKQYISTDWTNATQSPMISIYFN